MKNKEACTARGLSLTALSAVHTPVLFKTKKEAPLARPPGFQATILVIMCSGSTSRYTDMHHQFLYFLRWRSSQFGDHDRYREVHDRTHYTEGVGFDTHEPV